MMSDEVDDDPSATARRPGDRAETGWLVGVGHGGRILARTAAPSGAGPVRGGILSANQRRSAWSLVAEGTVIIIGGAEDKVRDRVILSRFVALAGGVGRDDRGRSRTASSLGLEAGERYKAVFGELGVTRVRPLHAVTRPQANDETAALAVRDATGIFLTGGNQLRLSSTIGGTRLADAILERFRHGAVVAGTSAGASAMSSHMIAFGASGATPKHRMAQIAAGLGVLPGVIVDQHFQQRNRLGRLLSLIAQNPACSASASTRTRPASSAPTTSWRSSGAARSRSSTARSPRPTPGRSAATGR